MNTKPGIKGTTKNRNRWSRVINRGVKNTKNAINFRLICPMVEIEKNHSYD